MLHGARPLTKSENILDQRARGFIPGTRNKRRKLDVERETEGQARD
jgi:hypothetical protein